MENRPCVTTRLESQRECAPGPVCKSYAKLPLFGLVDLYALAQPAITIAKLRFDTQQQFFRESAIVAAVGRKASCERSETPEGASMICSFTGDSLSDIVVCEFQDNRLVKVLDMLSK